MCAYTCPVYRSYVDIHPYFFFSNSFIAFHQVASSLNSSYCYILHSGSTVFTWSGSLTTSDDQELVERQLDLIKVWQDHCFLLVDNQSNRNAAFYGSYLFEHICNGRKASKIFNMYHYAFLHFHKCALYNIYIYIYLYMYVVVEGAFSSCVHYYYCSYNVWRGPYYICLFSQSNLLVDLYFLYLPIVYSQIFSRNHRRKIPNLNSFGNC
jgi:hypothetical protein